MALNFLNEWLCLIFVDAELFFYKVRRNAEEHLSYGVRRFPFIRANCDVIN